MKKKGSIKVIIKNKASMLILIILMVIVMLASTTFILYKNNNIIGKKLVADSSSNANSNDVFETIIAVIFWWPAMAISAISNGCDPQPRMPDQTINDFQYEYVKIDEKTGQITKSGVFFNNSSYDSVKSYDRYIYFANPEKDAEKNETSPDYMTENNGVIVNFEINNAKDMYYKWIPTVNNGFYSNSASTCTKIPTDTFKTKVQHDGEYILSVDVKNSNEDLNESRGAIFVFKKYDDCKNYNISTDSSSLRKMWKDNYDNYFDGKPYVVSGITGELLEKKYIPKIIYIPPSEDPPTLDAKFIAVKKKENTAYEYEEIGENEIFVEDGTKITYLLIAKMSDQRYGIGSNPKMDGKSCNGTSDFHMSLGYDDYQIYDCGTELAKTTKKTVHVSYNNGSTQEKDISLIVNTGGVSSNFDAKIILKVLNGMNEHEYKSGEIISSGSKLTYYIKIKSERYIYAVRMDGKGQSCIAQGDKNYQGYKEYKCKTFLPGTGTSHNESHSFEIIYDGPNGEKGPTLNHSFYLQAATTKSTTTTTTSRSSSSSSSTTKSTTTTKKNVKLTVTFNYRGGQYNNKSTSTYEIKQANDVNFESIMPTYSDNSTDKVYKFKGWATTKDNATNGVVINNVNTYLKNEYGKLTSDKSITLYASYITGTLLGRMDGLIVNSKTYYVVQKVSAATNSLKEVRCVTKTNTSESCSSEVTSIAIAQLVKKGVIDPDLTKDKMIKNAYKEVTGRYYENIIENNLVVTKFTINSKERNVLLVGFGKEMYDSLIFKQTQISPDYLVYDPVEKKFYPYNFTKTPAGESITKSNKFYIVIDPISYGYKTYIGTGYLGNPLVPSDKTANFYNSEIGNSKCFPYYCKCYNLVLTTKCSRTETDTNDPHSGVDLNYSLWDIYQNKEKPNPGYPEYNYEVYAMDAGNVYRINTSCVEVKDKDDPGKLCGENWGNYVMIDHNNGYKTVYAHLKENSILVKEGQSVQKGQRIATMGNTGHSFGRHLHIELWTPKYYPTFALKEKWKGDKSEKVLMNPSKYINSSIPYVGK